MPYSDPEKRREYTREYRKRNREKLLAYGAEYRARNPDYQRNWYAKNSEHAREYARKWAKYHPDRRRAYEAARAARKLNQYVEDVDPVVVLIRDAGICGLCESAVDSAYHIDHIVPLSKGGEHSYANTQVAHAHCNIRKGNRV